MCVFLRFGVHQLLFAETIHENLVCQFQFVDHLSQLYILRNDIFSVIFHQDFLKIYIFSGKVTPLIPDE